MSDIEEVNEIDFEHTIKRIDLNDTHVAIMSEKSKVYLYEIENNDSKPKTFPFESEKQITQFFMNKTFMIMLDNTSKLKFYHIEDKNVVMEHKPDNSILRIFPNKNGTKLILQHQNG